MWLLSFREFGFPSRFFLDVFDTRYQGLIKLYSKLFCYESIEGIPPPINFVRFSETLVSLMALGLTLEEALGR